MWRCFHKVWKEVLSKVREGPGGEGGRDRGQTDGQTHRHTHTQEKQQESER